MTANDTGGGVGPPDPPKEKVTLAGGSLNETKDSAAKLINPADDVNNEIDRLLRQWMRTGVDYYRRLAHAAADALTKQSLP